ncbi:hypothetical protein EUGRSUZ_H01565 [Eucalyptus grandis]|uniref:Uncharacterized protein n=2 Tax=Eucalyptus grandis TaxID=71139 RepID=A0ACC3JPS0_EUCGR|nr:hypothetical protein EUGRSUZ_H01565 [Eucalyptus grandis]
MIVAGVSVSFIIGTVLAWRVLALIGLIPCAVLLFGLFFIPESPRWLAKTGHEKEFEAALQKLRGKDADISEEAAEIQDYIETLQLLPKASILDLFQRRYLSSVIIGVGLMVVQQFGGINGVCFYTSNIFEEAGFSSSVGTITYAILQISGTGSVLGCIVTALSFFLKYLPSALQCLSTSNFLRIFRARFDLAADAVPILAVTGILLAPATTPSYKFFCSVFSNAQLYIAAFSAGMSAVPWVVMSEIFPINIKGVAGGFATLVNWFGASAVSYTFNYLGSPKVEAALRDAYDLTAPDPGSPKVEAESRDARDLAAPHPGLLEVATASRNLATPDLGWPEHSSHEKNVRICFRKTCRKQRTLFACFTGTFLLYAVINAVGMVFVITEVPETKGRSLEQIQAAVNRE